MSENHVAVLRELLANEYAVDESVGMRFTTERAAIEAAITALECIRVRREWVVKCDVTRKSPGDAAREVVGICKACKGSGEVEDWVEHPSGDPQDGYRSTVPCSMCDGDGVAMPRPLKDLLHFTEHCISAADEGEDYSVPRPWIDAMTAMGIMEKVGRGQWSPTDQAEKLVAYLSAITAPAPQEGGREELSGEYCGQCNQVRVGNGYCGQCDRKWPFSTSNSTDKRVA